MDVLAIITARGGSKRLPGKNIREFCGKPLIAWTIEAAKDCSRIVVTTDSFEIADISQKYGADVLLRPKELATDGAKSIDVVIHALDSLGWVGRSVLLQPTSPLRTSEDIKKSFNIMSITGARSVVSVNEDHEPNGAIYMSQFGYWHGFGKFYGYDTLPYIMSNERSIDIDTLEDFERAENEFKRTHK